LSKTLAAHISPRFIGYRFIEDGNLDQVPFRMLDPLSNGLRTSLALPNPASHMTVSSPTTTKALKLNLLPPSPLWLLG